MSAAFDIELTDGVSAPAAKASGAVKSLSDEFDQLQRTMAAQDKLANRVKLGEEAQAKAVAEAKRKESDMIAALQKKALAGQDQDRDARLGLEKMRKAQQEAAAGAAAAAEKQRSETSKWFSELTASGDRASESLAGVRQMAEGAAQAFTVGITIVTAYAAALYSLAAKAVGITQAKDQLLATFNALSGGMGQATLTMLSNLSRQLPFTTGQLATWARGLMAAGLQGQELATAVRAVASATAIMGESGGAAAQTLIKRLAMTAEAGGKIKIDRRFLSQLAEAGVSVQALAAELGIAPGKLATATVSAKQLGVAMQQALIKQGKGPLGELGLTWDTITAKINEGINSLFADLGPDVKKFMAGLQGLASEFFKGGVAAGQAKGPMTSLLRTVFEIGTRSVRAVHLAFLELEIGFLKAKIAMKPITGALDKIGISGGVVNVAMYLLAGTAITLAVVFGVLALAVGLVVLPFVLAGLAIYGIVKAIMWLGGAIGAGIAYLQGLQDAATQAGINFILGLGNAISSGAAWVVGLVKDLAGSIIAGITGPLKIKSPSRVAAELGGHFTTGLAMGIEGGTPDVEEASRGASSAAVRGTGGGGAGARAGGITIGDVTIQVMGGDGKTWQSITREALALILEEAALQAGL